MMANDEDKTIVKKGSDVAGPEVALFETWVQKHYGESSRTKTITSEKYLRICQLIRGEDSNTNAKFRFWVRSKGFRLISHDKTTDEVIDDPSGALFVSLHAKEDTTPVGERSIEKFLRTNLPAISFFRKVAMVEEFYDIIKCAHVDEKGVHAGQKKTYRLVSDTYAFLPREVITFYLLNCNTCKPRIQKYGPIHSKIRMNNTVAQKVNAEKNSIKTPEPVSEVHERDSSKTSQIIRPSPKRFLPTYIDETFPEIYSKIYESQLKSRKLNDLPTSRIEEMEKYYQGDKSIYPAHMIETKCSDQQFRDHWDSRSNEEDYTNFSSHIVSRTANCGVKSTSPIESYPVRSSNHQRVMSPSMLTKERESYKDIDRRMVKEEEDDTKEITYQRKNVSSSYPEMMTCSGACCSNLRSTLDYYDKKKERSDRFHGYRMEPYKLFQRNDSIRNYQERILEAQHNKDVLFHPHGIPYFADNKDRYISLYRANKGWSNIDLSSSSIWHKSFLSGDITESSWKSLPKRTAEKAQIEYTYRDTYQ